jgi:hypothetical protein
MWRAETFDREAIVRELELAAGLGFTSLRVFLHDLLWQHDREGFLERLDGFLGEASTLGIGTLLVLFDGVWDPHPSWGAPYVQGLLEHFRDDPRIDGWDLFNEPDNPNPAYASLEIRDKGERSLELLRKAFAWAREVEPGQPLTAGVWRGRWGDESELSAIDRLCLDHSDVVSFHHYGELGALQRRVAALGRYQRPIWCTEWLARGLGSHFDPHLAWMKRAGVGAWCWGLVAGRTQTHLPWDSWLKPCLSEPAPWHHEILRADGSAYDEAELAFIRSLTAGGSASG